MGFSLVEVCLARRGWHCKSLPNAFPPKASPWRVCSQTYRVAAPKVRTTLYLLALQPTKRGANLGRADRKKSYRPGDVSLLVARLRATDGNGSFASCSSNSTSSAPVTAPPPDWEIERVVGGGFRGAESRPSSAYMVDLEPGDHSYLIVPLCLGQARRLSESLASCPSGYDR